MQRGTPRAGVQFTPPESLGRNEQKLRVTCSNLAKLAQTSPNLPKLPQTYPERPWVDPKSTALHGSVTRIREGRFEINWGAVARVLSILVTIVLTAMS
jgi:hypothetical protein